MTQKAKPRQGVRNGQPKIVEPASKEVIVDALGEHTEKPAPKPPVNIDLDDALGDEQALKHDLLEDQPPRIEVRQPRKREFFMVHPTFHRVTTVLEYTAPGGVGRTYYLVSSQMKPKFEDEDLKMVDIVPCMSLSDYSLWLWPMNIDEFGGENRWNSTSRDVAEKGRTYWVRRVSRRKVGGTGYTHKFAPEGKELAKWPEGTLHDWLEEGFKDLIISMEEHPVYLDITARLA